MVCVIYNLGPNGILSNSWEVPEKQLVLDFDAQVQEERLT